MRQLKSTPLVCARLRQALSRLLLVGGFLAGYGVLFAFERLVAAAEPFDPEDFVAGLVAYVVMIGGTLLVPWVLLPIIANEPRRTKRATIAFLAGLLPAAVAIGSLTCLFLGWDALPTTRVAICVSIAAWFLPAIGALADSFVRGTSPPAGESKPTSPLMITVACVFAPAVVGLFSMVILAVAGWVTRTESPNAEQVAHAREFLLIDPDLEIEPLACYEKDGADYMVRFKFVAMTQDPARIFERTDVDPSEFASDFSFPPGEVMHNEPWWDISSQPMTGGHVRVPHGRTLTIGYVENDDGTFTVYAFRHEGPFELAESRS